MTFDELPLEDLGNRIPNITAEILADAETTHPTQHVDLGGQGISSYGKAGWRLDPERPWIYNLFGGQLLKINRVSGEGWVSWIDVALERRGIWHLASGERPRFADRLGADRHRL
jgi:hypothetical protein